MIYDNNYKQKLFWVEYIPNLFNNPNIIPLNYMTNTYTENMNCITRLIIFLFIIIFICYGFKQNIIILFLITLLFIIILYYIQKDIMTTHSEYYKHPAKKQANILAQDLDLSDVQLFNDNNTQSRLCRDVFSLDDNAFNNPNYISRNQKLAGPPNPKTNIPPVIVAPSHDLDYWKATNLVTHSAINEETVTDTYSSGYNVSTNCNNQQYNFNKKPLELIENFKYPYLKNINNCLPKNIDKIDQINTSCGYKPEQLCNYNLPTNYISSDCEANIKMKDYNRNLFTQTIQPGVYTTSQIIEPINSNIGISMQQENLPTTVYTNTNNDDIYFTEHDPVIFEKPPKNNQNITNPTESNVYDPRFTGAGTSYRSYTDNLLGQTKFYYDDIEAITMPNYLTRNDIDFTTFGDTYGPLPYGQPKGNKNTSNIHELANNTFLQASLHQRNDLMQKLMRKRNNEMWQLRSNPINTNGRRMLGGMSSCL